jgi:carbon-monoxide dehydrogenase large subunit
MTTATLTREQREAKLEGMGCKRKRVEDIRFTQGKGTYIDDLKLPGMLFGDFVRSQHAHARVKRIDTSKALKVPGVLAVLTAEELKGVNLAWMPTLAQDVQMVLPTARCCSRIRRSRSSSPRTAMRLPTAWKPSKSNTRLFQSSLTP